MLNDIAGFGFNKRTLFGYRVFGVLPPGVRNAIERKLGAVDTRKKLQLEKLGDYSAPFDKGAAFQLGWSPWQ
jgi:hypothetical protein